MDVWVELEPGDDRLVQATGRDRGNLSWQPAIATFADEVEYEQGTAVLWKPAKYVEIDPRRQFGEPIVAGTRIAVRTVLVNLEVGTVEEVADWYGLTLKNSTWGKASRTRKSRRGAGELATPG